MPGRVAGSSPYFLPPDDVLKANLRGSAPTKHAGGMDHQTRRLLDCQKILILINNFCLGHILCLCTSRLGIILRKIREFSHPAG